MKAYDLVSNLIQDQLLLNVDEEVGWGAQGQVFSLKDSSNQVIKISILYDTDPLQAIEDVFAEISSVYEYIMNAKTDYLVPIHSFGHLLSSQRDVVGGKQKYIVYYSVQDRLEPLDEDEKKVFKTICQAANGDLVSNRSIEDVVQELSCWFDFNAANVLDFYRKYSSGKIIHLDFHRRNIMKNADGKYILIDFDLALIGE